MSVIDRKEFIYNITMADQKQSLKTLRAEAKALSIRGYSKLSVPFLIDAIKEKKEQNYISDSLNLEKHIVYDTTTPEAKGQPEPVPETPTIPATPSADERAPKTKTERKTRKKKQIADCSLTLVHVDKPNTLLADESATKRADETADEPAPKKKGPNKWQLHVQAFRSEHPELSYKQSMIDAKATYKTQ